MMDRDASESMIRYGLYFLLTTLSVICVVLSPAVFTPAVFLSLGLLIISGILGAMGHLEVATVNFFISMLACIVSPLLDTAISSSQWALGFLIPFLVGLTGLLYGIQRLRRAGNHSNSGR